MFRVFCIALLVLLTTLPAASAEVTEGSSSWSSDCQPPPWVPLDARLRIEVCDKVVATCQATTTYGEGDPFAIGTAGFRAKVPVVPASGRTLHVHCSGVADVAALNYGTNRGEPRWVNLQLGMALGGDAEPSPAVMQAWDVYAPAQSSYLELQLDFQISMAIPGYTIGGADIVVYGPAALHNTEYLPTLGALEPPGIHAPFIVSGEALTISA